MESYKTKLVKEAYEIAGSPINKEIFLQIFWGAFIELDKEYLKIAYFIFDCGTYHELAIDRLKNSNLENNSQKLKTEKALLRQRAHRAKKEILQTMDYLYVPKEKALD